MIFEWMRSAVISRCCSCKRGRREWGLLVALSTIILSNVIHTSLPPHVAILPFYSTFNLQFGLSNALIFFLWTFLISFSFRLPSHTVLIYPQGSSAAIAVSFGNYKNLNCSCAVSFFQKEILQSKRFVEFFQ